MRARLNHKRLAQDFVQRMRSEGIINIAASTMRGVEGEASRFVAEVASLMKAAAQDEAARFKTALKSIMRSK